MHRYQLLKDRFNIRSGRHIYHRFFTIYKRYGLNASYFSAILNDFSNLLNQYGIKATLPVTALVFNKNQSLFKRINPNVEFAVHGLRHVDYTHLDHSVVRQHLETAARIFNHHGVWNPGFRFPYLGRNDKLINLVSELDFRWDSSEIIDYGIVDQEYSHSKHWKAYQRLLKYYKPSHIDSTPGIPYTKEGLLEIPVSLPDDDILVDQFHCRDSTKLSNIWIQMLKMTIERNSHLVLQIHPERFSLYKNALTKFFNKLTQYSDIWVASLNEIADWYTERKQSQIHIQKVANSRYHVNFQVSPRSQILIRNLESTKQNLSLWGSTPVSKKSIELYSPKQPIIGAHPETSESILSFLNDEGLPYIISKDKQSFSFFINSKTKMTASNKKSLLSEIEKTRTPLIRLWRWPKKYRCAVSITGDIDCVSFWDFFTRFYE